MAKRSQKSNIQEDSNFSIFTKPWFVLAIVFVCFAILTPKIFIPIFRQLIGIKPDTETHTQSDRMPPPHMRSSHPPSMPPSPDPSEFSRSTPQFGRPGPSYAPHAQPGSSSNSKSLLTFLLPVYAIGIGCYMVYTLMKVFNKNEKKEDDEESDFESIKTKTKKFTERNYGPNVNWDAGKGEFKFKPNNNHFPRSEESEDEMNNYENYKNLDPDYVNYIKEMRRAKRLEADLEENQDDLVSEEIQLSPNLGMTSITNTNVLMNDTLERMKFSLNKINLQLTQAEKKGNSLEDPELDDLRLQLSQTEQQMAKIFNIVNTVSNNIHEKTKLIQVAQQDPADSSRFKKRQVPKIDNYPKKISTRENSMRKYGTNLRHRGNKRKDTDSDEDYNHLSKSESSSSSLSLNSRETSTSVSSGSSLSVSQKFKQDKVNSSSSDDNSENDRVSLNKIKLQNKLAAMSLKANLNGKHRKHKSKLNLNE